MLTIINDSTRMELRQVLGARVANQMLEVIDGLAAGGAPTAVLDALKADVAFMKEAEAKHGATVSALIDSHMKLQKQFNELKVAVIPVAPPPTPPADPAPPADVQAEQPAA